MQRDVRQSDPKGRALLYPLIQDTAHTAPAQAKPDFGAVELPGRVILQTLIERLLLRFLVPGLKLDPPQLPEIGDQQLHDVLCACGEIILSFGVEANVLYGPGRREAVGVIIAHRHADRPLCAAGHGRVVRSGLQRHGHRDDASSEAHSARRGARHYRALNALAHSDASVRHLIRQIHVLYSHIKLAHGDKIDPRERAHVSDMIIQLQKLTGPDFLIDIRKENIFCPVLHP